MKLPRLDRGHQEGQGTSIEIYTAGSSLCVDLKNTAVGYTVCSILNEQEVSDLITMLQYYKLQVWPEGKENH